MDCYLFIVFHLVLSVLYQSNHIMAVTNTTLNGTQMSTSASEKIGQKDEQEHWDSHRMTLLMVSSVLGFAFLTLFCIGFVLYSRRSLFRDKNSLALFSSSNAGGGNSSNSSSRGASSASSTATTTNRKMIKDYSKTFACWKQPITPSLALARPAYGGKKNKIRPVNRSKAQSSKSMSSSSSN